VFYLLWVQPGDKVDSSLTMILVCNLILLLNRSLIWCVHTNKVVIGFLIEVISQSLGNLWAEIREGLLNLPAAYTDVEFHTHSQPQYSHLWVLGTLKSYPCCRQWFHGGIQSNVQDARILLLLEFVIFQEWFPCSPQVESYCFVPISKMQFSASTENFSSCSIADAIILRIQKLTTQWYWWAVIISIGHR